MNEQIAEQFAKANANKRFTVKKPGHELDGKTGTFEVLEDCNCCAPTNTILFSFQMDGSRKVMAADEAVDLIECLI